MPLKFTAAAMKNSTSSGTPHSKRLNTGPKAAPQLVLVRLWIRSRARLPSAIWLKKVKAMSHPRAASAGAMKNSTAIAIAAAMKTAGAGLRLWRTAPFI